MAARRDRAEGRRKRSRRRGEQCRPACHTSVRDRSLWAPTPAAERRSRCRPTSRATVTVRGSPVLCVRREDDGRQRSRTGHEPRGSGSGGSARGGLRQHRPPTPPGAHAAVSAMPSPCVPARASPRCPAGTVAPDARTPLAQPRAGEIRLDLAMGRYATTSQFSACSFGVRRRARTGVGPANVGAYSDRRRDLVAIRTTWRPSCTPI